MLNCVLGIGTVCECRKPTYQIVIVVGVICCYFLDLLLENLMESLLDLSLIDHAVSNLVNPIELVNKKTFELLIIFDFETDDAAVVAFIDLVIVLADECIEEDFVVKRVNCSLLLLLLQQEESGENALFDSTMDKRAYFFLRECPVLNTAYRIWFREAITKMHK